ncbi:ABC transporter substrate-binding protein [Lachnospiraceae bacterium]|nr:ABC transporter substrate-binding protein [Lachnospiraceae bacterium]
MKKKILALATCICLAVSLAGCGGKEESRETSGGQEESADKEAATLNIAYQYGVAYAPLSIVKEQGLIEKAYEEAAGKKVTVTWNQMSSGADINTGISAGSIDAGFMGAAPAITGVTKGVGYKIFTNLSGQEHGLMTNDENIQSFEDLIGSSNQIALVNIGSIQHIMLAMALENAGYDPHALDANIVAMAHPDGMAALESGNASCHLTSNPYIFKERQEENLHEIMDVTNAWGIDDTFIVGVASETMHDNDPELYQALCGAIEEAVDFINGNPEEAAKITCEFDGNSEEEELEYIQKSKYSIETSHLFELASFMARTDFIETAPESYEDLVFDNVSGD